MPHGRRDALELCCPYDVAQFQSRPVAAGAALVLCGFGMRETALVEQRQQARHVDQQLTFRGRRGAHEAGEKFGIAGIEHVAGRVDFRLGSVDAVAQSALVERAVGMLRSGSEG